MYIDIHRHSEQSENNITVLRNLFPEQFAEFQDNKYYSIGLHPWHVKNKTLQNHLSKIKKFASDKRVIAIGETGLDQKVNIPYLEQLDAFEKQIEISEEFKLPVIIHCVKAYDDIISIRKKTKQAIPWIIHWFNSSNQIAKALIDLNCFLSYGCMLFKETSKAFNGFPEIPLEWVFLETDDTEYTIKEVYEKAASVRNISVPELQDAVKLNFKRCFNIEDI